MLRTTPLSTESIRRIVFDRAKYGMPLLADACAIEDIRNFTVGDHPHRLGFHEIALITGGRGALELDDASIALAPRRVIVTAPGEVRRWRLADSRLEGFLVFFEAGFVNEFFRDGRFVERMPFMSSDPARRSFVASSRPFDALAGIAGGMRDELRNPRTDSEHALRADTYRLLVALQRLAAPKPSSAASCAPRAHDLRRRFVDAVEEHFARRHRVGDYAAMLGVSARYLNACVGAGSGATASATIHRRQFLEARRLLLHTRWSVSAISERLGFSEPSWFIRFFKRNAGMTPGAFRVRHESDISVPVGDLSGPMR